MVGKTDGNRTGTSGMAPAGAKTKNERPPGWRGTPVWRGVHPASRVRGPVTVREGCSATRSWREGERGGEPLFEERSRRTGWHLMRRDPVQSVPCDRKTRAPGLREIGSVVPRGVTRRGVRSSAADARGVAPRGTTVDLCVAIVSSCHLLHKRPGPDVSVQRTSPLVPARGRGSHAVGVVGSRASAASIIGLPP